MFELIDRDLLHGMLDRQGQAFWDAIRPASNVYRVVMFVCSTGIHIALKPLRIGLLCAELTIHCVMWCEVCHHNPALQSKLLTLVATGERGVGGGGGGMVVEVNSWDPQGSIFRGCSSHVLLSMCDRSVRACCCSRLYLA